MSPFIQFAQQQMIQTNTQTPKNSTLHPQITQQSLNSISHSKQNDNITAITNKNITNTYIYYKYDICKVQQNQWIQKQVINDIKSLQIDQDTKEELYLYQNCGGGDAFQIKRQSIDIQNQGNQDNLSLIDCKNSKDSKDSKDSRNSKRGSCSIIKQEQYLRYMRSKEKVQNKNKSTQKYQRQLFYKKVFNENQKSTRREEHIKIDIEQQNIQTIQVISLQQFSFTQINNKAPKTKKVLTQQKQHKKSSACYYQIDSSEQKQQLIMTISKQCIFNKIPQFIGDKFELYSQYRRYIEKILTSKVASQRKDYPQISYSLYRKILTIWEKLDNQTKNRYVGKEKFLKYGHLQRLSHGRWLNDEIISAYLNLMVKQVQKNNVINVQQKYMKDKYLNDFIMFDSLKTMSIFQKSDHVSIAKILYKNNAHNLNKTLILAIYDKKHWFFLTCKSKPQTKQSIRITIYDSLPLSTSKQYLKMPIIQKIIKFMYNYYHIQVQINICANYPKQYNSSDCGVMMLCGIKDIVRDNLTWNFQSCDMNYKRILITKQLIEGQLVGL